jgi:hypothetical protein
VEIQNASPDLAATGDNSCVTLAGKSNNGGEGRRVTLTWAQTLGVGLGAKKNHHFWNPMTPGMSRTAMMKILDTMCMPGLRQFQRH